MIGYYVHHVGRGHLRQAECIAAELDESVTGISSLARPPDWDGDWLCLPRDDSARRPIDPTAYGRLHWAPRGDPGLCARMGAVARWIEKAGPAALVVDVSVEITVFARLMGVPVVVVALPGERDDPAHQLAYSIADKILAPWPAGLRRLDQSLGGWLDRTQHVGGISRFAGRAPAPPPRDRRTDVVVLEGAGGGTRTDADIRAAAAATPGRTWRRLGVGAWVDDPWAALCGAQVVVSHAGLGGVADVAAAGRPAVVIPQERPHDEQLATAAALGEAALAVTIPCWPAPGEWAAHLDSARRLGGSGWSRWSAPGGGARRAAAVIAEVAGGTVRQEHACG